ncbi:MAG: hypothetical protein ACLSCX_06600 [Oscillospiraceae bacterium]|jgi:hypothetical protein
MIYITISKADAFARKWWKEPENVNAGAVKWSENTKKEGKTGHSFRNLTKMVEISEKLMYNDSIQEGREEACSRSLKRIGRPTEIQSRAKPGVARRSSR